MLAGSQRVALPGEVSGPGEHTLKKCCSLDDQTASFLQRANQRLARCTTASPCFESPSKPPARIAKVLYQLLSGSSAAAAIAWKTLFAAAACPATHLKELLGEVDASLIGWEIVQERG